MKKNTMMRIASILLVAVLITTCAISGTYAKYVTAESGGDSARVAKFGVVVNVDGAMFAETYDNEANGNDAKISAGANITVNSDGSGTIKDLVAPGTQGDMVAIKITGQPEVDVEVTYDATVTFTGWATSGINGVDDDAFYCPLVLTINGTDYYLDTYADAATAKTAIEDIIEAYTKRYNENTDLETKAGDNLTISWSWPFHVNDDNDKKDTALGNAAATNVANASTIAIEVTCTVTQID